MMSFISDSCLWAEAEFGSCDLGDPRRVRRLVDYAARQAEDPAGSVARACRGDKSATEGAYRLIRNEQIDASQIAEGAFGATAGRCEGRHTLLSIQDTTDMKVAYTPLARELAQEGCPTGFVVHSALMVDAETSEVLGWIDQQWWVREAERPGTGSRRERRYEEKESYKWELAHRQMELLLTDETAALVITVGDRETDIFEFIQYLTKDKRRYILRASQDRSLEDDELGRLWSRLEQSPVICQHEVPISQRGGQKAKGREQNARDARKKRIATVEIRAARVTVSYPRNRPIEDKHPIETNVVYVKEPQLGSGEESLEWMLLTSEPIATPEQCLRVVKNYEKRWVIEEIHKVWKTGCRMEDRLHETRETVERMMAITAPIAVRIYQLASLADHPDEERSCEEVLTQEERDCLWTMTHRGEASPTRAPSALWAYITIARLGGWLDTKKTGRAGWQTLWRGWEIFQERLVGWRLALNKTSASTARK